MRTHTNHLGDNPDMENVNQFIAEQLLFNKTIKGYGKVGHGMNGKDADLDDGGQCVVDEIFIIDPVKSNTMFIEMHIERYASICTPCHDDEEKEIEMQEVAEMIIMDHCEYEGEWTGSDYWSYKTKEIIRVPLTVDEYENPDLDILSKRCADAIYNSKEGSEFEEYVTNLNKKIESIE